MAKEKAEEYCSVHKGWKLICDIKDDITQMYVQYEDLSYNRKVEWERIFGENACRAYDEYAIKDLKKDYKKVYITETGKVYNDIQDVFSSEENFMTIVKGF